MKKIEKIILILTILILGLYNKGQSKSLFNLKKSKNSQKIFIKIITFNHADFPLKGQLIYELNQKSFTISRQTHLLRKKKIIYFPVDIENDIIKQIKAINLIHWLECILIAVLLQSAEVNISLQMGKARIEMSYGCIVIISCKLIT